MHEYGHNVQYSFQHSFIPEAGGFHRLAKRYNPHLSYSEGWSHYFAAAVTDNPAIMQPIYNFDLSDPDPINYYDPGGTVPETPHWGIESEVHVAAALWWLRENTNDNDIWEGARENSSVTSHFAYTFPEFIQVFQEQGGGIPSGFSNRTQELHLGTGKVFVTPGENLQAAIDNAQNGNLIYVFNGTYQGNFSFDGRVLALFGESPLNTILRSAQPLQGNVVLIGPNVPNNEYSQIDGFTIENGFLGVDAASSVYVSNNIVRQNVHGICSFTNMVVRNNVVNPSTPNGSGILIPGNNVSGSYIFIYNNHLENNDTAINFENNNAIGYSLIYNNLIYSNNTGVRSIINNDNSVDFEYNALYGNTQNYVNFTPDLPVITNDPQIEPNSFHVPTAQNYRDGGYPSASPQYSWEDRTNRCIPNSIFCYTDPNSPSYGNFIGFYGGPSANWIESSILPSQIPVQTVSGSISEDTFWSGEVIVTGDVTIENGAKLTIFPGCIIRFYEDKQLVVNGRLDAQGTEASPITFTSIYQNPDPEQYWSRLKIVGSGSGEGFPSIVKHAIVENARYGLFAYNSHPVIENTIFRDNRYFNVYLSNSNAELTNNTIQNSLNDGVFLYYSSPQLFENVISGNPQYGVHCYSYSSPQFGSLAAPGEGWNVVRDNSTGIYTRYYSNPFLGETDGGDRSIGGYNSIHNNWEYAMQAAEYCEVQAKFNWWGEYPPLEEWFLVDEGSLIDYSYPLNYDPNEEMMARTLGGNGRM